MVRLYLRLTAKPSGQKHFGSNDKGDRIECDIHWCYNEGKEWRVKDKDLLKLLLYDGWEEVNIKGSHHKLRKGNQTEIIPVHGKDLPKGLLKAIVKRTGVRL